MSPASYLTAPPRVAARSLAPPSSRDVDGAACSIDRVWLLAAILVWAALTIGGIAYAVLRGLALWRSFERAGCTFGPTLAHIADAGAQIEAQMTRAQEAGERLKEQAARLQQSRARLEAQVGAVSGAVTQVRRLLWFLPGM